VGALARGTKGAGSSSNGRHRRRHRRKVGASTGSGSSSDGSSDDAAGSSSGGDGGGVRIDFDGILERVTALPLGEGQYGSVCSVKGEGGGGTLMVLKLLSEPLARSRMDGRQHPQQPGAGAGGGGDLGNDGAADDEVPPIGDLIRLDLATAKVTVLCKNVRHYVTSPDRKGMVLLVQEEVDECKLLVCAAGEHPPDSEDDDDDDGGGGGEGGPAPSADVAIERRVAFVIDPGREWAWLLLDGWRQFRGRFYDRALNGVKWRAKRLAYSPLVDRAATREEFEVPTHACARVHAHTCA
jgi:hypothetical protein